MTKSLTIAILNYNSGEYLSKCLESLKEAKSEAKIRTIVIDNNSTDRSLEIAEQNFKEAEFIKNKENLGFSKGYNDTLKKIKSEYILLLNPDCILKKGVIKKILEDFEGDEKIGAATCRILLPDGKIDLTAHRGFPTPWASLLYLLGDDSLYHLTKKNTSTLHEVDSITGAFFMTKSEILNRVGFLDENFFLYGEDLDLCFRIKKAGFKVVYDPQVSVTHYKGISSGLKKHSQGFTGADIKTRKRAKDAFYEAMIIFYNKHYKNKYPFFVNWMVYLGIYMKWWLSKIKSTV